MLVLSRHVAESIVITCPDETRITLMMIEIRNGKARIGIDAPKDYSIHREEIQNAIDAEKTQQA